MSHLHNFKTFITDFDVNSLLFKVTPWDETFSMLSILKI